MDGVWYRWIGGGALLLNGLGAGFFGLLGLLSYLFLVAYPAFSALAGYELAGLALFLVGVPVIQLTQPKAGRLGWLGIGLLELGAVVAFTVVALSWLTKTDTPEAAPLVSALAGLAGDVLVGYLTARLRVFPIWVGWSLALAGIVNFATGLTPASTPLGIIASLFAMLGAAAVVGYGWGAIQRARGAAVAFGR